MVRQPRDDPAEFHPEPRSEPTSTGKRFVQAFHKLFAATSAGPRVDPEHQPYVAGSQAARFELAPRHRVEFVHDDWELVTRCLRLQEPKLDHQHVTGRAPEGSRLSEAALETKAAVIEMHRR